MLALVALTTINSCKKSNPKADCEINKYGTITISNSSSNPYKIYVDDIFQMQISGGSISNKIKIKEGNNRKLYAEQVSGYRLYPTTKTNSFNVISCSNYSWQIP